MASLAGLRVLDLAGPLGWYCTKLFADLGADVLRLEPAGGDPARNLGPFWRNTPDTKRSIPYWHFNTSKRSETIDLVNSAGRARFKELASQADVVVETAAPGSLVALGIGYAQLSDANPGLVWTAVTPFGQTGPFSQWKANDLVLQAVGGLMVLSGMPERPPSQLGGHQAEYQAGVIAACGTLAALFERDLTGAGQFVDISGQAAVALDGENAAMFWDINRQVRKRLGGRNYRGADQVFQAKDGWVIMSMGGRWTALRLWLDKVGLLTEDLMDPKWESPEYRFEHINDVEALTRELCARQTCAELYAAGQAARVIVAPIVGTDELFSDPQLAARGFWRSIPHPEIEADVTYPGPPFRFSHSPWQISRRPPLAGEHTGEGWLPRPASTGLSSVSKPLRSARHSGGGSLRGLRIVDLTWVAAGPLSTRMLASFGADVIKVESQIHPDGSRNLEAPRPPGNDSLNVSGTWNSHNQGKKSITLDLRNAAAIEILERLIGIADVLVDNYGVDPYAKWGLTLDRLRSIRPDLIIARSSTMGRSGPRQQYIGFGYTIAAAAGHNSVTGFPGDPPVGPGIAHPDYSCNPYHLVVAILAALRYRDQTGIGQTIDLSQHESTVTWLGPELMDYAINSTVAGQCANRSPFAAPHGAFPAKGEDRWLAIACRTDGEFAALCRVSGRTELTSDARFATLDARKSNEDALDAEVGAWTAGLDAWEAMALLQAAGVPAGVVQGHRELMERDPQMLHRGHFWKVEHPEAGLRTVEGTSVILSRTPSFVRRHAPLLGQDNDRLLGELLGLSEQEIAEGYVEGWIN